VVMVGLDSTRYALARLKLRIIRLGRNSVVFALDRARSHPVGARNKN
jgi:hypothetical protein